MEVTSKNRYIWLPEDICTAKLRQKKQDFKNEQSMHVAYHKSERLVSCLGYPELSNIRHYLFNQVI